MSKEITIEISDMITQFRPNSDKILSLEEFVTTALRKELQYNKLTALEHTSFELKQGQTLGLIERNGTRKSTLLKIISGILKPAEGRVSCCGSIVPMPELDSGFDFGLTGRRSAFLNGAILGYNEEFLKGKYNEIVESSELGQLIGVPVRDHSSGILARLVFFIATVVSPDIPVVNGTLSVGDIVFQEKSRKRMLHLMGGDTVVLFVPHSIEQIQEMCGQITWPENGLVKLMGSAEKMCDAYESE